MRRSSPMSPKASAMMDTARYVRLCINLRTLWRRRLRPALLGAPRVTCRRGDARDATRDGVLCCCLLRRLLPSPSPPPPPLGLFGRPATVAAEATVIATDLQLDTTGVSVGVRGGPMNCFFFFFFLCCFVAGGFPGVVLNVVVVVVVAVAVAVAEPVAVATVVAAVVPDNDESSKLDLRVERGGVPMGSGSFLNGGGGLSLIHI